MKAGEHSYFVGVCEYEGPGSKNAAYITWRLEDGRFSMCAHIWDRRKRDHIAGGQCVDAVADLFPGNEKVQRMRAIWERWHLNDMCAGSPAQEEYLRAHPVEYKYPESHYDKACEVLRAVGLHPDNGYLYGSRWLREELPPEVLAEIESWVTQEQLSV